MLLMGTGKKGGREGGDSALVRRMGGGQKPQAIAGAATVAGGGEYAVKIDLEAVFPIGDEGDFACLRGDFDGAKPFEKLAVRVDVGIGEESGNGVPPVAQRVNHRLKA
jgi:hypothetical protein